MSAIALQRVRTLCLGTGLALTLGSAALAAQQNIGATETAKNQVSRELAGAAGALNSGDPVFRNEVVKTGQESTAKLVFLDSTNLAVGPTSRVVLDRFVYEGGDSNQTVAVKLTKGLFRFTTGSLDKNSYSVTTPEAAIGVRGTILEISVRVAEDEGHASRRPGDRLPGRQRRRVRTARARLLARERPAVPLHGPRSAGRDGGDHADRLRRHETGVVLVSRQFRAVLRGRTLRRHGLRDADQRQRRSRQFD